MHGGPPRLGLMFALATRLVLVLPAAENLSTPSPASGLPAPHDLPVAASDAATQRQAVIAAALASTVSTPPTLPGSGDAPDLVPPLPPAPHTFETASGQFEISSFDLDAAGAGLTVAEEVWQTLERPLNLPARGFPSSITVRLLPAEQWRGTVPFQAAAELGGRVSVRVRWSPEAAGTAALRQALVQALLMRVAITAHGLEPSLRVPLWLEQGCLGWSLTHARPALLDEWQQDSARVAPPALSRVLGLKRDTPVTRPEALGTLWLLSYLQAESGPERRWPLLLGALLGGEDPVAALGRIYGGDFHDDPARELWWQVGWHSQRRLFATAVDNAADSRAWVTDRARWVARSGDADILLSLDEVFAARQAPWVAAELQQRIGQLKGGLGTNLLHPFYRNAAVSLGRAYEAARAGNRSGFGLAEADLDRDCADGVELETAAEGALDQMEASGDGQKLDPRIPAPEVGDGKSRE